MKKYTYHGPFKAHIQGFIELKQAIGYKYLAEAAHLKRFDTFTCEKYNQATTLTRDIVLQWCTKKAYEKQENLCARASVIRQLAVYVNNVGDSAYILPKNHFRRGEKYVPHIYTDDELKRFFQETDKCRYCCECPNRHLIMPILFRLLYSCGLRVSEARLLKVGDVDLGHGILAINHSKNDKNRLVPIPDEMTRRCREYSSQIHPSSNVEDYYFPIINNRPMSISNVYSNFRRFLWKAGISHGGRGAGPRVHDFRHTFAVHRLKKWFIEEKDLMACLPLLRIYLGHDSFGETAYYLRMTADVYPTITLKLETAYPNLIPVLEGGSHGSH